jgi:hypothetical protein
VDVGWPEGYSPMVTRGGGGRTPRRRRSSGAGRAARWGWRDSVGGEGACQGVVVGVEGAMAAAHSEPISPEQNNRSGGGPVLGALGRREEKGNWMGVLGLVMKTGSEVNWSRPVTCTMAEAVAVASVPTRCGT